MSERQEKRRRTELVRQYREDFRSWREQKPEWWQFINRRKWRRARPEMPKCLIVRTEKGKEVQI